MKRHFFTGWEFFILAPLVIAGIIIAFGVAGLAAYENYRLGKATEQMIHIISLAREMSVPSGAPKELVLDSFLKRLEQVNPADIQQRMAVAPAGAKERFIETPWGDELRLEFYPAYQALRLQTSLSTGACRRFLRFYAKDLSNLWIRRIDVAADTPFAVFRSLYSEPPNGTAGELSPDVVMNGCGLDGGILISITVSLI